MPRLQFDDDEDDSRDTAIREWFAEAASDLITDTEQTLGASGRRLRNRAGWLKLREQAIGLADRGARRHNSSDEDGA